MRLISRGSESNEIIRKRMKRVEEEAKCISNYDYLIVNDEIDKSVRVLNMIIEISRNRTVCKASFIKRLCEERCT